jgi:hypothetical protein
MTSLAFVIQKDKVCIAMDTLVVGHGDKRPMAFQRKFIVLQPSGIVIAGTGLGNMINAWFQEATCTLATLDLDALQSHAQGFLQKTASQVQGLDLSPASLFHFGWSAIEEGYAGFVCRPGSAWSPVRVPENLIRMQPEVAIDQTKPFELPGSLVNILLRQQLADKNLPVQDQQGIGGEIEFVYMHERRIEIMVIGQFPTLLEEKDYVRQHSKA